MIELSDDCRYIYKGREVTPQIEVESQLSSDDMWIVFPYGDNFDYHFVVAVSFCQLVFGEKKYPARIAHYMSEGAVVDYVIDFYADDVKVKGGDYGYLVSIKEITSKRAEPFPTTFDALQYAVKNELWSDPIFFSSNDPDDEKYKI